MSNSYEKTMQYKWCVERTGSLWKVTRKSEKFGTDYGILCRINREQFALISESGNRWDEPENALAIYDRIHGLLPHCSYNYEFIQSKFDIRKLFKPAYQVLFTESDND